MWVKHVVRGEACDQATCLLEDRLEAALVGMAGDRWSRLKTAPLWRAVGAGGLCDAPWRSSVLDLVRLNVRVRCAGGGGKVACD